MHNDWKIERNKRDIADSRRKIPYSLPVYCRLPCEYMTKRPKLMRKYLNHQAEMKHSSHIAAGHLTADQVEGVLRRLWPVLNV